MSARKIVPAAVLAVAALALSACGAGGFGGAKGSERTVAPITSYVALGDGFASAPYLGADTSGNGCLRSADNYPSTVATALKVTSFTDVTCYGATSTALTAPTKPPGTKKTVPAQLDAITKDTDLVTLGIGIEDRNLLEDMFHLCTALPCGKDIPGGPLLKYFKSYGTSLTNTIRQIQDVAPDAYVVVVGYPQIMPAAGLCTALPDISDAQLDAANTVLQNINNQLASSARQAGAVFAGLASVSADHSACSSDPWVNGFRGKKGREAAFHPRPAEQTAAADAVIGQVRSR